MLASNRQIRTRKVGIHANSVVEHLHALGKHAVPQHAIRDVVLHLASDRARVAPDTAVQVYSDSQFRHGLFTCLFDLNERVVKRNHGTEHHVVTARVYRIVGYALHQRPLKILTVRAFGHKRAFRLHGVVQAQLRAERTAIVVHLNLVAIDKATRSGIGRVQLDMRLEQLLDPLRTRIGRMHAERAWLNCSGYFSRSGFSGYASLGRSHCGNAWPHASMFS